MAPDVKWVKPLYDPGYDRLWAVCQDLDVPVNVHGGTGLPDYGPYSVANLLYISDAGFYSQRPLVQFILSGIFERFPRLNFVMTETGCAWLPPLLAHLDATLARIAETGQDGRAALLRGARAEALGDRVLPPELLDGREPTGSGRRRRRATSSAAGRFMWGSDYPHNEGTAPYTREHLRLTFHDADPQELHEILAGNAARLYDFDLAALAPLAERFGPTEAEIARPLTELPDPPNEALLKGESRLVGAAVSAGDGAGYSSSRRCRRSVVAIHSSTMSSTTSLAGRTRSIAAEDLAARVAGEVLRVHAGEAAAASP